MERFGENGDKSIQNGAKREPKGDQNTSKSRCPKNIAKGMSERSSRVLRKGVILVEIPSKMHPKINARIDPEKI